MAKRGRPRDDCGPYNLKALCKIDTLKTLDVVKAIRDNPDAPPQARLKACEMLLDRGHGKPMQAVEIHDATHAKPEEMTDEQLVAIASGAGTVASQASAGKPH